MVHPTTTRRRALRRPPRPPDAPSRRARFVAAVREIPHDPTRLIGAVLAVATVYLVIAPLVAIASDGVRVQFRDAVRIGDEPGAFTAYYLGRVFTSAAAQDIFWTPLVRTLVIATGTTVLSVLLGAGTAWLVVRTDVRFRRLWSTVMVIPFIIPTWTFVLAWLTVFKNRRVAGPQGFAEAAGIVPPDWLAYGPVPIIIVSALSYFPLAFLLFGNAVRSVDSQLEESAQLLGATRLVIARRIVLPLLLPALSSSVLLVFARTVGSFSTPYVLGLPTGYSVLATSLYSAFQTGSAGVTAMLATVMVVIGAGIVALDIYVLREYARFVTIGSKGSMSRTVRLGRWRTPCTGLLALIAFVSIALPLIVLFLSTIMRIPGRFTRENLTTAFWLGEQAPAAPGYAGLLRESRLIEATINSLWMAGGAALLCGVAGLLIGYAVARLAGSRLSSFLRQTTFLPYLIPSIALSAAFLSLFAVRRGPIPSLYGTLFLLMLVMVVDSLPYASRAGISAMLQLGREPEEAAMMSGASWRRRMTRIVIPIQKGALATAVVLPLISGMRELDIIVMLATPGTQVLTTLSFNLIGFGYTQLANGVALLIVLLVFVVAYLAQRLTGTDLASGLKS
jgi:iron(III) transport system permease protein